uniref:Uncharacterized protein n=1 Tax=Rhizochromulina marina TaxID=1034831 RepID=A0A7S2S6D0_9STRA|mmetsp:Transcript_25756/g.75145  ORF Transcript_25756/g.75145 Transcript_25756/m.75145 type:complete len:271 (+) Transcript_25756:113-925(+)
MALPLIVASNISLQVRAAQQLKRDRDDRRRKAQEALRSAGVTLDPEELVDRMENAGSQVSPGSLAALQEGRNPMKEAIDMGSTLAVQSLVELDHLTLTLPCCVRGPPLVYLRSDRDHPHRQTFISLLEGLGLARGMVPFSDGTLVPVDCLLDVASSRSEDRLKDLLRAGKLDMRQLKTLRVFLSLPQGIERDDPHLSRLVSLASRRENPFVDTVDDEGMRSKNKELQSRLLPGRSGTGKGPAGASDDNSDDENEPSGAAGAAGGRNCTLM